MMTIYLILSLHEIVMSVFRMEICTE